MTINAIFGP